VYVLVFTILWLKLQHIKIVLTKEKTTLVQTTARQMYKRKRSGQWGRVHMVQQYMKGNKEKTVTIILLTNNTISNIQFTDLQKLTVKK